MKFELIMSIRTIDFKNFGNIELRFKNFTYLHMVVQRSKVCYCTLVCISDSCNLQYSFDKYISLNPL